MVYERSIYKSKIQAVISGLHDCEKFRTFVYFLTY